MPMSFSRFFLPKRISEAAHHAYVLLAEESRAPIYYAKMGVADSLDGRFDMMALFVGLAIRRLKRPDPNASKKEVKDRHRVAQELFDYMFDDLDRALRELGVGDLSIGKRIKKMAHAFYGRIDVYSKALDADDRDAMKDALARNLYRGVEPDGEILSAMVEKVFTLDQQLANIPFSSWLDQSVKLELGK